MSEFTRTPLIAGNWKLHKTVAESVDLATALHEAKSRFEDVDVLIAPVATSLYAVSQALGPGSDIMLAGQNTHSDNSGAFTGELSPALLLDVGCTHCIVGHSERRHVFGETDSMISAKVKALLDNGLTPILCVGEKLDQRDAGDTESVVLRQLKAGLEGIADPSKVIIAYEPVWAIGTGRTAAPADAQAVHAVIRAYLAEGSDQVAQRTRILYGGSVKPGNALDLIRQPDIDGALVGGASLKPDLFIPIIEAASTH